MKLSTVHFKILTCHQEHLDCSQWNFDLPSRKSWQFLIISFHNTFQMFITISKPFIQNLDFCLKWCLYCSYHFLFPIVDSAFILKNMGQRTPVFWHILRSIFKYSICDSLNNLNSSANVIILHVHNILLKHRFHWVCNQLP